MPAQRPWNQCQSPATQRHFRRSGLLSHWDREDLASLETPGSYPALLPGCGGASKSLSPSEKAGREYGVISYVVRGDWFAPFLTVGWDWGGDRALCLHIHGCERRFGASLENEDYLV